MKSGVGRSRAAGGLTQSMCCTTRLRNSVTLRAELADILGSRSRASEVFARRRPFTLEMIQKINAIWKIPADLLVQPYQVTAKAA
jgi:hypothetical protein